MKVAVFSTKTYDRSCLEAANVAYGHELTFFEPRLTRHTSPLASGFPAICVFVNDQVDASVLRDLTQQGTRLIALRCAGFNHVDLAAARELGVTVVRVPAYSPHAVAEHTVGLILALNRKIYRAYARVREGNFSLDGLLGFDLCHRTIGIVGTGRIGVMVINTSRGALIDTRAVVQALKSGQIGYLGLDVYEEEAELFFEDLSTQMIQDDVFSRLLTFPNVVITGHQGFFTAEALQHIAATTLANMTAFERGQGMMHQVSVEKLA
jgi:D-lactate dehydrogenase